jgi:hypothetical protein
MKVPKKIATINLPVWMDLAVRDLAQKNKRSISGEIEFLIEEAVKNNMPEEYEQQQKVLEVVNG